jgi:hypothetical protein
MPLAAVGNAAIRQDDLARDDIVLVARHQDAAESDLVRDGQDQAEGARRIAAA